MGRSALIALGVAALALASCNNAGPDQPRSEPQTLYRNSPVDPSMRLHWATFDADDGPGYNENNCKLAAKILNANVEAASGGPQPVGFWCEAGAFKAEGLVPSTFEARFPVD